MIYSIGHSTLSEEKFLHALQGKVSTVIDIRSHPTSRWPQFQKENMEKWLADSGVNYEWEPRLGGWDKRHVALRDIMRPRGVDVDCYSRGKFPKQRIGVATLPASEDDSKQESLQTIKPTWTNQGLYDFSWFMSIREFLEGADDLFGRGMREDVAILCCEGPWYKCHRSMVADYMCYLGSDVHHLPGKKLHSTMIGNRLERYDSG